MTETMKADKGIRVGREYRPAIIASPREVEERMALQYGADTVGRFAYDWHGGASYEKRIPWDAERLTGMFVELADVPVWCSTVVGRYLPSKDAAAMAAAVDDVVEGKTELSRVWNAYGLDTGSPLFRSILGYVFRHRLLLAD